MDLQAFELGVIVGLQAGSLLLVFAFVSKGAQARRRIRQYLDKYAAEERKKRGL